MTKYRPAIKILLKILECISRGQAKGRALKTHVIQCANLKTTSADKYIEMLVNSGYISEKKESWGERTIIVYEVTSLGRERYEWFKRINDELFESGELIDE
jgi:predicted transcriptional regulator